MSAFMETTSKANSFRSTDKVVEALSTLAALLDRTINEVKGIDAEFQSRLLEAIHQTEQDLQRQSSEILQREVQEVEQRVREQLTAQLTAQFEEQIATAVDRVRTELESERDRLSRELDRATQAAVSWEAERARLIGECTDATQAVAQARLAQQQAEAKSAALAANQTPAASNGNSEAVQAEIQRVEALIQGITALIDNPATELATVIRKNVERAELDSYLKGIRFAFTNGK